MFWTWVLFFVLLAATIALGTFAVRETLRNGKAPNH